MAQLAIKGHPTRGKEVVEILEMLGGVNKYEINGSSDELYIIRENDNAIILSCPYYKFVVFTLEEFLEKYPYKVGDKVYYDNKVCDVIEMRWTGNLNTISYGVYDGKSKNLAIVEELKPYKEETMEETDTIYHTTEINLNHPCFNGQNEIELIIPNGWEFEQRGNKMFGVRKQYSKTYEECCKVLGMDSTINHVIGTHFRYRNRIMSFIKLLICRDAYWKIYGEEVELGKSWEPDWTKADERKHCIVNTEGNITKWVQKTTNKILAFPTEGIRNVFYENFKDLIEECKELL